MSRIDRPLDSDRPPERPELPATGPSRLSTDSKGARLDRVGDRLTSPESRPETRPGADAGRDAVLSVKAGSLDRERDAETPGDGWDAFWNYDGKRSVAELRTAKTIHDPESRKADRLRLLTDEELIRSFDEPHGDHFVLITSDGRIMNGHHRVAELLRRADDPRSGITDSIRVRVDPYDPDHRNDEFFWDWSS